MPTAPIDFPGAVVPPRTVLSGVGRKLDRLLPPAVPLARSAPAASRRWGWQLLAGVGVFAVAQSTVLLGTGIAATVTGTQGTGSRMDDIYSQPLSFAIGACVSALVAVGGYWVFMRWIRGVTVTELAGPGKIREYAVGLGLGTLLITVVVAVLAVCGCYRVTSVGWDEGVLIGIGTGLAAGFAEEILFRGLLLRLLEQWLGTGWALGLTAVLFGAVHITNPEASIFGAVAIMLEAGVLLGACYLVTRRLWLAFGTHTAWNFVQGGIFGSDISGTGTGRGLFEARFTGPELLTGGDMGIEGSLVAVVVCTAAGLGLMLVARRRGLLLPRRPRAGAMTQKAQ
ncbi:MULTISPECIES: CPBP family intramembrane glutamic endopeptidase [unclassified Actinomyces]|uniref:CPBP family intramembrane glutamic endopeptidase n=1 Tax=unclassified Actinomyces TaxID=2609248 RepID=UPI000D58D4F7|nr:MULTISPECIES: CPBP family intramembrane glutamic endopeptidase [unclassified Actinomyces]RAX21948.1 CPBP family intramembrane metalloprotease [Actinomyces sp. Z5]RAX22389.1 CPBP family intramembrane metalloprotease [Actinomyces sp. Z3]